MYLVGLTGGIASGKSTVAARLVELGVHLIDADLVARDIVQPGQPAYDEIIAHFGPQVVQPDDSLDRAELGRIVFNDRNQREALNAITHPRIRAEIADRLMALADVVHPTGIVVLDIALLVEMGTARDYDAIVVVAADVRTQLERLVRDRGMSVEAAQARVGAQASLAKKLAVATHVIYNDGSMGDLVQCTDAVHAALVEEAAR